ncbi:MAG TPA: hypothetical protein VLF87_00340 [Patescibacteria group bacterium]|nr:hypothetical protein [Patescibacteria group bacterium]
MTDDKPLPCANKLSYDTKVEATGAAAAVDWQYGARLVPYKCRHCHLWHLTTEQPN